MQVKVSLKHPLASFAGLSTLLGALVVVPAVVSAAPSPKTKAAAKPAAATPVEFDRDVLPILSENCFACHGFDSAKRAANLRLDVPEGAYLAGASGKPAIVPGKPAASEVIRRVGLTNGLKMPPESSGKHLKSAQIAILKRWIAQGAQYAPHWAFVTPKRPALPAVKNAKWPINPIDTFVLSRLEKEGLKPAPAADRRTLIRRVTLDLTGLPPTPAEVDAFLADTQPGAYERVVDRLLKSPHYGERMAVRWLDLARYADTHGYHIDSHRDMWRWRDWVIQAFNQNLPYDQFTTWQIAGDLLPNPTLEQRLATGFNRNHPINFEGGAIPEEYQTAYVVDRVSTTSTVFLGLTIQCAQCHDHKYDPITNKDFYQFYAYFNNIAEQGLDGQRGNAAPFIKAPLPGQTEQLAAYDRQIGELDKKVQTRVADASASMASWEKSALAQIEQSGTSGEGLMASYTLDEGRGAEVRDASGKQGGGKVVGNAAWAPGKFGQAIKLDGGTYVDLGNAGDFEANQAFSYGAWVFPNGNEHQTVLSRMDDANGVRGWDLFLGDGKVFAHLIHTWEGNALRVNTKQALPANQWHHLFVTYDGSSKATGLKVFVNGKPAELDVTHDRLQGTIKTDKPLLIGRRNPSAPFKGLIDDVRIYSRAVQPAEVQQIAAYGGVRQILEIPAESRSKEQKDTLVRYYLENHDAEYRTLTAALADTRKKRTDLDNSIPTSMVMQEREQPRETFILLRGQYDQKGEKVTAGVPAVLRQAPQSTATDNRLALAKWLVDPNHPLTSRVAVNRFWELYYGIGLVGTSENFGTQGERPSHPELLDWLATEFIRTGWDVKALQRLIVTSNTYKQSSKTTPRLQSRDPENRLLARGPRFRLSAEFVRDQALAVSGLLVPEIGGPSVKPYQPKGLWEEIAFGGDFTAQTYVQDHGEKLYRRSMYTFWKRTCPPPSLQTFDAPEREFCMVRRSVSNTPLQALVLMNDITYVEAARKFAERMMKEAPGSPAERIAWAYQVAASRAPRAEETQALLRVYEAQLAHYQKDTPAAEKLLTVGESPRDKSLDAPTLAAWTSVASAILTLDEVITRG